AIARSSQAWSGAQPSSRCMRSDGKLSNVHMPSSAEAAPAASPIRPSTAAAARKVWRMNRPLMSAGRRNARAGRERKRAAALLFEPELAQQLRLHFGREFFGLGDKFAHGFLVGAGDADISAVVGLARAALVGAHFDVGAIAAADRDVDPAAVAGRVILASADVHR